ncbi:MAG: enoyl-CoA hydratase/isomerase family protein [Actinobacteria bacterium]|nr:enoyl-CoA hydratase/isomerase family protein [Actinomycetota bacterium]
MPDPSPLFWPLADLLAAYARRELSPIEVTEEALARSEALDDHLRAYLTLTPEVALEQARAADAAYAGRAPAGALLGVPTAVKDLFDVAGVPTTLGSMVYRGNVAPTDSVVVARLREAGAVFVGKANTAEFGQSATTENLLSLGCGNPWDPTRTPGGSSGGSAAAVGAGLASVALGSDGGGSIRIPAAFSGLFGIKPTFGGAEDGASFRAMTEFACPGPLTRTVADGRALLGVILGRALARGPRRSLRIGWCPQPLGAPVDPGVRSTVADAVAKLPDLGHRVEEIQLPLEGWKDVFGPLVLADEWAHRRDLLQANAAELTTYARASIEASAKVTDADLDRARKGLESLRADLAETFSRYDLIVTPTNAVPAFEIGRRPREIDGQPVDALWGAFPFTAAFNVAGTPAASVPCGIAAGLPVGLQVVGPHGAEELVLDFCEELQEGLDFPRQTMAERWSLPRLATEGAVKAERQDGVAVLRISRSAKRGALSVEMLKTLAEALESEFVASASAVVLTGEETIFSAGADLTQVGKGLDDLAFDDAVAAAAAAIRRAPIPVIAAVEGPCMGAAIEIVTACDVIVAGAGAKFNLPATQLGILYRPAALRGLIGRVGQQTVARLVLLGEAFDAETAMRAGIVAEVVASGSARDAALRLTKPLASAEPAAVAATKSVLRRAVAAEAVAIVPEEEELRRHLLIERGRRQASEQPAKAPA